MQDASPHSKKATVSTRILIGLLAGVAIGIGFNYWGANPTRDWILANLCIPVGDLFLRSLFMVVVPMVFCSLTVGVANLGSAGHVRKLGGRLGLYYIGTTLLAVLVGQFLVSVVKPGTGISPEIVAELRTSSSTQVQALLKQSSQVKATLWPGIIEQVVPKNIIQQMAEGNVLAVIFVALVLGVALLSVEKDKSQPLLKVLDAIYDACILLVGWIMKLAPYAVGALLISTVSKLGINIIGNLLQYMFVVIAGYLIYIFVVYSALLKFLIRYPVGLFYKKTTTIVATAFSTSSSNATLPTTMQVLEKRFGIPESIITFSIPLGSTLNQNGTALFEAVAALFIAQVFGVEIGIAGQVSLVLMVVLTSMGVAGIPGGSIPLLMSAMAMVGIPPEGIALILGVDRILDMGRTVLNVIGDVIGALYLARVEGVALEDFKESEV